MPRKLLKEWRHFTSKNPQTSEEINLNHLSIIHADQLERALEYSVVVDRWDMEELLRIAWEHPKTPAEYCKELQDKYLPKENK